MSSTGRALMNTLILLVITAVVVLVPAARVPAQSPGQQPEPKRPWMDKTLSPDKRADLVISQMTLDEKISRVHGVGVYDPNAQPRSLGGSAYIPGIPRLGIPDLQMDDDPLGVTHGAAFGRYSTILPSGTSEASSWDLKLAHEYGALTGRELRDQGYNMSLGGSIDLTHEPRILRTFEFKGEDPILAGKLVGAQVKAEQEQGVIGHIKHYTVRYLVVGEAFSNSKIDKRAMHESDLLAFEIALKDSGAGAVMCSPNLVNGDYACENKYLLDVLKKEIGFQGFVETDWHATHSTVKAALAGLDLEMPDSIFFADELKKAVESGQVPMSRLDDMVHRILRSEFAAGLFDLPSVRRAPDVFKGLAVAQSIAEQGSVLLKNSNGQLPLSRSSIRSVAVIGSHADVGVPSGGGPSQVDSPGGNAVPPPPPPPGVLEGYPRPTVWFPSSPLKAIRAKAPDARVEYNAGTDPAAAADLARGSDVAIVFVHQHMIAVPSLTLPDNQDDLVSAVAAANPHTIVVLETSGPVTMPWIDNVSAVLEAWFPGIKGAEAIAAILFGDVNPTGKLPLTFPRSEADLPLQLVLQPAPGPDDIKIRYPGAPFKSNTRTFSIDYSDGLKVGYKWYDAERKEPLFPFGYGLSYTTYSYSDIEVKPGKSPIVTFTVKNTGARAGAEIAEVYVELPPAAGEPFKRLVAWEKVQLAPGEAKTVTLTLEPHYLEIFNADKDAWELVPGNYKVLVGGSSRETPLSVTFNQ